MNDSTVYKTFYSIEFLNHFTVMSLVGGLGWLYPIRNFRNHLTLFKPRRAYNADLIAHQDLKT